MDKLNKQLRVRVGQYSSSGRKKLNQDCHAVSIPDEPLLGTKGIVAAIADGISSSDVSQIASATAVKGFIHDYYCTSETWSVKSSAQRVLSATNSWLYAQTQSSPYRFNKDRGYICTFSALVLKSHTAHIFHSGDSRIYYYHNAQLEQLTRDHRHHVSEEQSYLTRALGIHNYFEVDYDTHSINLGDVFVLATDGIYEFLNDVQLAKTLAVIDEHSDLDALAKSLHDQAFEAGSTDNLSLQIIFIKSLGDKQLNELKEHIQQLALPPKLQARKTFDGYDILRDIYISSRSHVYLAKDSDSGEKVIIKTPSAEMRSNKAYLESFLMEDWIAKRINNPHVMKAPQSSRKQNYLYTVSEYIEGKTLKQWMIDNSSPDIDTVRAIVTQIATGLQAFHRKEMVHQDLRPNNVMIDTAGTVKIIDFGACKVAGINEIKEMNEGLVGTAQYTAPEYFLGDRGNSQSDIFSLGVICYQMLSGSLPYGIEIPKIHDSRRLNALKYRPLTSINPSIPDWLDFAIKKAVSIQREKRYIEVSEFIHELKTPNPSYIRKTRPPLIERNPVLFWQSISALLSLALLVQWFYHDL